MRKSYSLLFLDIDKTPSKSDRIGQFVRHESKSLHVKFDNKCQNVRSKSILYKSKIIISQNVKFLHMSK